MTANEMAVVLSSRTNRVDSAGGPGFLDVHYSRALTEALWYYITKFVSSKTNLKRESFEDSEIRGQGLSALINQTLSLTTSASQVGVHTNGTYYDLPEDFMVAISESPLTSAQSCVDDSRLIAQVDIVSHDSYRLLLENPYRRPRLEYNRAYIWRLFVGRTVDYYNPNIPNTLKRCEVIVPPAFTVQNYRMDYLKIPPNIIVDLDTPANQRHCILDISVHEAIVDIAVSLLKRDTDQQSIPNPIPISEIH